jgi:hypothetical protein
MGCSLVNDIKGGGLRNWVSYSMPPLLYIYKKRWGHGYGPRHKLYPIGLLHSVEGPRTRRFSRGKGRGLKWGVPRLEWGVLSS